mgnify:CR=1 FL=1
MTIRKSKHPKQPYTFSIDKPGRAQKETRSERYSRASDAKRAAFNILNAIPLIEGGYGCILPGHGLLTKIIVQSY